MPRKRIYIGIKTKLSTPVIALPMIFADRFRFKVNLDKADSGEPQRVQKG